MPRATHGPEHSHVYEGASTGPICGGGVRGRGRDRHSQGTYPGLHGPTGRPVSCAGLAAFLPKVFLGGIPNAPLKSRGSAMDGRPTQPSHATGQLATLNWSRQFLPDPGWPTLHGTAPAYRTPINDRGRTPSSSEHCTTSELQCINVDFDISASSIVTLHRRLPPKTTEHPPQQPPRGFLLSAIASVIRLSTQLQGITIVVDRRSQWTRAAKEDYTCSSQRWSQTLRRPSTCTAKASCRQPLVASPPGAAFSLLLHLGATAGRASILDGSYLLRSAETSLLSS